MLVAVAGTSDRRGVKTGMAGVAFSGHYRPEGIEYSSGFDMAACKIMGKIIFEPHMSSPFLPSARMMEELSKIYLAAVPGRTGRDMGMPGKSASCNDLQRPVAF